MLVLLWVLYPIVPTFGILTVLFAGTYWNYTETTKVLQYNNVIPSIAPIE